MISSSLTIHTLLLLLFFSSLLLVILPRLSFRSVGRQGRRSSSSPFFKHHFFRLCMVFVSVVRGMLICVGCACTCVCVCVCVCVWSIPSCMTLILPICLGGCLLRPFDRFIFALIRMHFYSRDERLSHIHLTLPLRVAESVPRAFVRGCVRTYIHTYIQHTYLQHTYRARTDPDTFVPTAPNASRFAKRVHICIRCDAHTAALDVVPLHGPGACAGGGGIPGWIGMAEEGRMDGRIWVEGRRRLDRIGMVGDRTVTCLVSSLSCPVLSCLVLSCLALSFFFFFFFFASTIEQILFGVDDWGGVRQRSPGLSFLSFFLFFSFFFSSFPFFALGLHTFGGENGWPWRWDVSMRQGWRRPAATGGDVLACWQPYPHTCVHTPGRMGPPLIPLAPAAEHIYIYHRRGRVEPSVMYPPCWIMVFLYLRVRYYV